MYTELAEIAFDLESIGVLPRSMQAMLAAGLLRQHKKSMLWLVENSVEMYALMDDLRCFLTDDEVCAFLPYDCRPYQDDSPSREVAGSRIKVLCRLSQGEPVLVVAPLDAVMTHTIPAGELAGSSFEIKPETELNRDSFLRELVRLGYEQVPLVDDVGQFSVRGFVLDVFSPGHDSPVRIDLFGDTVDNIKFFNPDTQRSGKGLDQAWVVPASEVVLQAENVRRARPLMRRLGGVDQLVRDMEQGIHVPGIEAYLPLFYEQAASLFSYFSRDSVFIGADQAAMGLAHDELLIEYTKGYGKLDGRGALAPDELLLGLAEIASFAAASRKYISTSTVGRSCEFQEVQPGPETEDVLNYVTELGEAGQAVFIYAGSQMLYERLEYALQSREVNVSACDSEYLMNYLPGRSGIYLIDREISAGFVLPSLGLVVVSADQLLGTKKKKRGKKAAAPLLNPFTQLNVGDAVVHRDNGVGIFKGVERLDLAGVSNDFVLLEYLGGDKLFVPVYKLNLLQRYIGDAFVIDRLGSAKWANAKAKAKESVQKMAAELLQIYAKREKARGIAFDTGQALIDDFEESFPFEETDDQQKAIDEMYADMASSRPMDRLICGDVGYGKTEVALRSCFAAVMNGKQAAMLVPTTLLARQHLKNFRERFEDWPVRVEAITSFSSTKANKEIVADLESGKVDVVIGTHGLLSKQVKFKDLGLLVVDEEHKFGVKHKERIKAMRAEVDILTLTATPIPRTLNLAISGIRDLSVIETPPVDRKSIDTAIARFDEDIIFEYVERELSRGGQVYFVHNQVKTIEAMAERLQAVLPEARIGVAHGQMPRRSLESVMSKFMDRKVNLLVASAIISSGIDISNANTIIINRADKFGLADLYQIRGRVGRSKRKGYALLLTPAAGEVTKDARKRLAAIKEYESLGAGFQMALRDMEIRGVGDILGRSQWGHVTAIGYELYQQMLKDAVDKLQGKEPAVEMEPEIIMNIDAYVPEDYCPDQHLRLGLYKRLSSAGAEELDDIMLELEDLYGPLPAPVKVLIVIAELREQMKKLNIRKLERSNNRLRLLIERDSILNLDKLLEIVTKTKGRVYPDGKADIYLNEENTLQEIRSIMHSLA